MTVKTNDDTYLEETVKVFEHENQPELRNEQSVPRKPWLAGLMSLLLPGLGQLYNGQPNRAIWFFIVFVLVALPLTVLVALALPGGFLLPGLLLALAATLLTWMMAAADAWVQARRQQQFSIQRWQTNGLYALVFIIGAGVILPAAISYVRANLVQAFRVVGASMEPTILPGELFFVDKRYNCPECSGTVARGDVAVFIYPNNRTQYYVKRVIALPGDAISSDADGWRVNNAPLATDEGQAESIDGQRWSTSGTHDGEVLSLTVPDGHVFVLGDNRNSSRDSRDFGVVPLVDVVGVARQVWWSRGAQGVRWHRFGEQLTQR